MVVHVRVTATFLWENQLCEPRQHVQQFDTAVVAEVGEITRTIKFVVAFRKAVCETAVMTKRKPVQRPAVVNVTSLLLGVRGFNPTVITAFQILLLLPRQMECLAIHETRRRWATCPTRVVRHLSSRPMLDQRAMRLGEVGQSQP